MSRPYRKLDVDATDIPKEIAGWSMGFPVGTNSFKRVLNRVVYLWFHAVTHSYDPPGCWLTYMDLSKDKRLGGLSRKTIGRAVRYWKDKGVLNIDEQHYRGTKGKRAGCIELAEQWHDPGSIDELAHENKRDQCSD